MGVKTVDEGVCGYVHGARTRLASASKRLHRNPCVRFALTAGTEVIYASSLGLAGLAASSLVAFFALLLLGPYLTFILLLYNLTPWSTSPSKQGIGFLLFVGSLLLFCTGYRLLVKYPQLRNMDNLAKIETVPVVFQIGVYYAFVAFCSLVGSLLTFDLFVAFYWACSLVFYGFVLLCQMISVVPWYFLALLTLFAVIFVVSLVPRVLVRHGVPSSAAVDYNNFSKNSRPRSALPV